MKNQKNKKNPTKIIPIPKSDKFSKDIKALCREIAKGKFIFVLSKEKGVWVDL